jgi:serine/threonine protein kinase
LFRLHHPLVLPLEFYIPPEGKLGPRIATEYLSGGSLAVVLADRPRWWSPIRKAITVAGIVVGMNYIHSCRVVHRNLKPSNILFNDDHRVRIADFGLSRLQELDVTLTRGFGTPLYMAPELFAPEPQYTESADVYSFGLILYEIVVGDGALSSPERVRETYSLLAKGNRPEIPESVLSGVRKLIGRCWARDPESRPTFGQIFEALESLCFEIVVGADSRAVRQFLAEIEAEIGEK